MVQDGEGSSRLTCARLGYQCTYRDRVSHRAVQAAVIFQLEQRVREAETQLARQTAASGETTAASSTTPGLVPSRPPTPRSPASKARSAPTDLACITQQEGLQLGEQRKLSVEPEVNVASSLGSVAYGDMFGSMHPFDMDVQGPMEEWLVYPDVLPSTPAAPALSKSSMPLSARDLADLHRSFFTLYAPVIPILAQERFDRELQVYPDSTSVRCLSYSVALLAISTWDNFKHLEERCYAETRRCIDDYELDETAEPCGSINFLQSLLFLTRYEVGRRKCARSYLTLARASRLIKLMRLDQIDQGASPPAINDTAPYVHLPETHDMVDLEERRRCFWAWYLLEGYSGVHTHRPTMQDDSTIFVSLPSPGTLDSNFEPCAMSYITEVDLIGLLEPLSPFSGAVLVVSLVRKVLDHASCSGQPTRHEGFWDRHYALVKLLETIDGLVKPLSSLRVMHGHPLAFDLQVLFGGAEMYLWEVALKEGEKRKLPSTVNDDNARRLLSVAQRTATTIRSMRSQQRFTSQKLSLNGAFVAWPICSAIKALRTLAPSAATDDSYINKIQMLQDALGTIEVSDGPWHKSLSQTSLREKHFVGYI